MMKIRENYNHTLYACFIGYIVQAIINNFAPLLFLTLQSGYGISLDKIALLISFNFAVQLLVDLAASKFVDRIGYRTSVVLSQIFSAIGLIGLAVFPEIMPDPYLGLLCAIFCSAIGGGLLEVLISPIVEACPTKRKEAAMSILHSFYCWGHVFVVLASTAFFAAVGIANWRFLACLWALVPMLNMFYFMQVPINTFSAQEGEAEMSIRGLFSSRLFWLMLIIMICAGACEQSVSQWASAFAEAGLGVSKTVGDLAGPLSFALLMGLSRALYAKFSEKLSLFACMLGSGFLCLFSTLLIGLSPSPPLALAGCALCGFSVGVLWPGGFSMAAKPLKQAGTALFAFLALGGDIGCSAGPGLVGFVSESFGGHLQSGIVAAAVFSILLITTLFFIKKEILHGGK